MTTINASNFTYVQFCHALIKFCEDQGLAPLRAETESGLPQNEGWCFLRFSEGGAALIIPKGKTRMGNLHSHVDLSGHEGFIPLPKKNGKVICHFAPDLEKVKKVVPMFVGAAKRATAAPTPRATQGATPSAPVDTKAGEEEAASWAASEEELDEAVLATLNG